MHVQLGSCVIMLQIGRCVVMLKMLAGAGSVDAMGTAEECHGNGRRGHGNCRLRFGATQSAAAGDCIEAGLLS
jgi:hypothetical protein